MAAQARAQRQQLLLLLRLLLIASSVAPLAASASTSVEIHHAMEEELPTGSLMVDIQEELQKQNYLLPTDVKTSTSTSISSTSSISTSTSISSTSSISTSARRYFHVNSDGLVVLKEQVDRERWSSFQFEVVVQDSAQYGANSGSATVVVEIDDVNDCAPQFTFPSRFNSSVTVAADAQVTAKVATLRAVDHDAEANGRLFFFVRQPPDCPFHVDADTGDLTLVQSLTREIVARPLRLTVVVRDGGHPPLEDVRHLTVTFRRSRHAFAEVAATTDNFFIIVGLVAVTAAFVFILLVGVALLLCRSAQLGDKRATR